jgi:hemolysin III
MTSKDITIYSPLEEKLNIISHAIGILLSIAATSLLVTFASLEGDAWQVVSVSIFGASMILLYTASTCYHSAKNLKTRKRLKVFDHAAIYALIAGTYTPFTLVTLRGVTGWVLFGISWGLALTGIILKLFFTGKYTILSTLMYVFMGWIIIFALKPLLKNLPADGLRWLFIGGACYTIGAVLYSIKKIKFNHAIFHFFVLAGSFCHFMAVFFSVIKKV